MKDPGRLLWLAVGAALGAVGLYLFLARSQPVEAATSDRTGDYIMCTGSVTTFPRGQPSDGVWVLDYRAGKLLGTVIDRHTGKINGWAEVDLVGEFGLPPRQNVHFMMTTGQISATQAALYVAETVSGKFAVYSMGPRADNQPGVSIRRHDMVMFRPAPKEQ